MSEHDGPIETLPPRKRRRPAKSCEQCRLHKIRCDREYPCGACVRSRSSPQCTYTLANAANTRDVLSDGSISQPLSSVPPPRKSRVPKSRPSRPPTQQIPRSPWSSQQTPSIQSPNPTGARDESIEELRQRVQRLEGLLSVRELGNGSSGSKLASNHHEFGVPATIPRLRITHDKTKLYGQGHWLHTAENFKAMGKFDAKEVEPMIFQAKAQLSDTFNQCRSLRLAIKAEKSAKLVDPVPHLLDTIPSKTVCDDLVRHYLRTLEPIYRIIHVPSFREEYDGFWRDQAAAPKSYVMKLVMILAIGTTFYADRDYLKRNQHLVKTWIYAAWWFLSGPAEKRTLNIEGLQIYCLLLIARQTNSLAVSLFPAVGSLVNKAMMMGLHHDPEQFPALTLFESEMRRRLWATVTELYVQISLDAAMPLLLSAEDFDTKPPLNIDDARIDPRTSTPPADIPSNTSSQCSLQLLLLNSLPLRLKVARLVNSPKQHCFETALKLGTEMRAECRRIAAFFHPSQPFQQRGDENAEQTTSFHRKFLDLCLRRYILFLHRPFMIPAMKDPRFYMSRKICLESSMVIASYADDTGCVGIPDELAQLARLGTGLFKGALGLDVVTILGFELITQLEEESLTGTLSSDPLDQAAKANRVPIILNLEHIQRQLLQIIEAGHPSLKRYGFISGLLSQIYALETGKSVQQAVFATTKETLKKCLSILQSFQPGIAALNQDPQPEGTEQLAHGFGFETLDCAEFGSEFDFDFDISNFLYPPEMSER